MASENKTRPGKASVKAFIDNIEDQQQRADCKKLSSFMEKVSGQKPVLWGDVIVGFGSYHYKYASGREGDAPLIAFSPRKGNIAVYTNIYLQDDDPNLKALGKFKNGKSCINVKKLDDINMDALGKIFSGSMKKLKDLYPESK